MKKYYNIPATEVVAFAGENIMQVPAVSPGQNPNGKEPGNGSFIP